VGTLRYIERDVLTTDYDRSICYTLTLTFSDGRKRGWSARATNLKDLPRDTQFIYDLLIWREILWCARHPVRSWIRERRIKIRVFFWSVGEFLRGERIDGI
jgi:hypothetical protein